MSNARLQLDMDFVPLWKQKYAEQIEFTFMWINIQNSSGALVITIWPLDPRVLNKEGSFQIFELTGMELWVFGYMKNINTKSISSISLSYILGKETHTSLSHCPLLNFELCRFVWYKWMPEFWSCVSMYLSLQTMRSSMMFWWQEMALMLTHQTICPVFASLWPDRAPGLHWQH